MAFEMYKLEYQEFARRSRPPEVTVKSNGILGINAASAEEIGNWGMAQLYWDVDKKRIGIKFYRSDEEADYLLKLRPVKKAGGYLISCKGFLAQYCCLALDASLRCPAWYDKAKRMLIVEVSKGRACGRKGAGRHG